MYLQGAPMIKSEPILVEHTLHVLGPLNGLCYSNYLFICLLFFIYFLPLGQPVEQPFGLDSTNNKNINMFLYFFF